MRSPTFFLLSLENSLRQQTRFENNPNHMQNTLALVSRRSTAEENTNFELESGIRDTFKHSGSFH